MAEEIGASAFITKPFSNAEVVERLRSFTGKSQQGKKDERAGWP